MHPKADEFILDVRRAVRLERRPTVTTDSQLIDAGYVTAVLQRATIWLSPKIVEAYNPLAFRAWDPETQKRLKTAVEAFQAVASEVPPDAPATSPQLTAGVRAFTRLKETTREIALSEWLNSAQAMIMDIESWAKTLGWTTRREPKSMEELLLGEYVLEQLYMYAEGNLYVLDPVARFIPGGLGAFDLSIQPSFHMTTIYRDMDDSWNIHLDLGHGSRGAKKVPLSPKSLQQAIVELRSLL